MTAGVRKSLPGWSQHGFSLLELLIVTAVLAILFGMGVPQYRSVLRVARVGKARQELITMAGAIDAYAVNNGGMLPVTLYEVGFGGKRDPWGSPYCYLNYTNGTGDGLEWAINAGLVDPASFYTAAATVAEPRSSSYGNNRPRLAALWLSDADSKNPQGKNPKNKNNLQEKENGLVALLQQAGQLMPRQLSGQQISSLARSLNQRPQSGFFAGVSAETTRRRDRYMFPLNTDYDLFSLGADQKTAISLGSPLGMDDVIRTNNGSYYGLASEY